MTIKKGAYLIILCLVVLIALLTIRTESFVYAEDDAEYGFDLPGEYWVRIGYQYRVKFGNGVYVGFDVTFDKEYYAMVDDKAALLNELKETFVKNGYSIETDVKNGKMSAYLDFSRTTDYYAAIGIDGYATNERPEPTKKDLFYREYVSENKSVFDSIRTEGKFVNRIYNVCVAHGIDDDRISLRFVYGTPYNQKKVTSNASDVYYSSTDRIYYHTFEYTMETAGDTYIIRQRVPNTTGWYVVSACAALVVLAVPFTVALIKKKEKNHG